MATTERKPGMADRFKNLFGKKSTSVKESSLSLTPEQKVSMEEYLKEMLGREKFKWTNFYDFVRAMILLIGQNSDSGTFRDIIAKREISFVANGRRGPGITVGNYNKSEIPVGEAHHEGIYYFKGAGQAVPLLEAYTRVVIPESTKFRSYITGSSESVSPSTRGIRAEKELSDKQAQMFCRRVYGMYLETFHPSVRASS